MCCVSLAGQHEYRPRVTLSAKQKFFLVVSLNFFWHWRCSLFGQVPTAFPLPFWTAWRFPRRRASSTSLTRPAAGGGVTSSWRWENICIHLHSQAASQVCMFVTLLTYVNTKYSCLNSESRTHFCTFSYLNISNVFNYGGRLTYYVSMI